MPTGADVTYDNYAFASGTSGGGTAARTMPQRIRDVYNVREFGALGNGSNDDTSSIQAAITAALVYGGEVFFPLGQYLITSTLRIGDAGIGNTITLRGAGGVSGSASQLYWPNSSGRDYIIWDGGTGCSSFEGLCFKSYYSGTAPTRAESASDPRGAGFTGDGCGCVYSIGNTGMAFRNCSFVWGTGVGLFFGGFQGSFENCMMTAGLPLTTNQTIGLMSRGMYIRCSKFQECSIGVNLFTGPQIVDFVNIERCGYGMLIGALTISYYDMNDSVLKTAGNCACIPPGVQMRNLSMESNAIEFIKAQVWSNGTLDGAEIAAFSQIQNCARGLNLPGALRCEIKNVRVSGNYTVAGVDLTGATGVHLRNVSSTLAGGGGVDWKLPNPFPWYLIFEGCDNTSGTFDGSVPKSQLSAAGSRIYMQAISNSDLPANSSGTSNIGKPVTTTGPANNKVLVRWDGTQYLIAG